MLLKKFMEFSKVVRVIILVIPFVNWIAELAIRWSLFIENKDDIGKLLIAILTTFGGGFIIGWIDVFWTILHDKLSLLEIKLN